MIIDLADAGALDPSVVGRKAANLAAAAARGLPVPPGFVVPADVDPEAMAVQEAVAAIGTGLLAVRCSALAEDLVDASYAGLYESYLNVSPADVPTAIRACRRSGDSGRVDAYRPQGAATAVAVLVQSMVPASVAGVAFTANPVTGARNELVINAVAGLAASLVAGESVGEQWVLRGTSAHASRSEGVLSSGQALAIGELARRAAEQFGAPQDIEWAIGAGHLHLLQVRPMTALPQPPSWSAPGPGLWVSNFRIGEWLPEPLTPLFGDWLLPRLDQGFRQGMRETAGAAVPFPYALVNGWYYTRPNPSAAHLPAAILRSHGRLLWFLVNALLRPGRDPQGSAEALLDGLYDRWRDNVMPQYQTLASTDPTGRTPAELIHLIDDVAHAAGRCLWYLAVVGGAAWKMEGAVRRYAARHGLEHIDVPALLSGLDDHDDQRPPHAVYSLDWYHPTVAETAPEHGPDASHRNRRGDLVTRRLDTEQTCESVLSESPSSLRTWRDMVTTAQRFARIREAQAARLTLGWPLLRSCACQLGRSLNDASVIDAPEEMFFLTRSELTHGEPLGPVARERRADWQRQRRLVPPLAIGSGPPLIGRHLEHTLGVHLTDEDDDAVLRGQPASPGRATGPARIVRSLDDFSRVRPGDVLVARATAPAWTPLFKRIVAVVTDAGTVAAHASIIAREYGIAAVVATGNATDRISDGETVTVDGGRGTVTFSQQR